MKSPTLGEQLNKIQYFKQENSTKPLKYIYQEFTHHIILRGHFYKIMLNGEKKDIVF